MNKPKIEDYQVPTSWDEVMETDTESYAKALEKWGDWEHKTRLEEIAIANAQVRVNRELNKELIDLDKQVEDKTVILKQKSKLIDDQMQSLLNKDDKVDALTKQVEELKDFAIWMTGCGYDFAALPYFVKMRNELLKDKSK